MNFLSVGRRLVDDHNPYNPRNILRLSRLEVKRCGDTAEVANALLIFISVHNCIFVGSWCCRCTEAARYTSSKSGVS